MVFMSKSHKWTRKKPKLLTKEENGTCLYALKGLDRFIEKIFIYLWWVEEMTTETKELFMHNYTHTQTYIYLTHKYKYYFRITIVWSAELIENNCEDKSLRFKMPNVLIFGKWIYLV